jgi:hypothetical protein
MSNWDKEKYALKKRFGNCHMIMSKGRFRSVECGSIITANNIIIQISTDIYIYKWGHAVAQWLRHCATNWKVMGLVPNSVTGIFH